MQKKIKSAFNEKDFQNKGRKWYTKENKELVLIISQLKVTHFKSDDSTSGRSN